MIVVVNLKEVVGCCGSTSIHHVDGRQVFVELASRNNILGQKRSTIVSGAHLILSICD